MGQRGPSCAARWNGTFSDIATARVGEVSCREAIRSMSCSRGRWVCTDVAYVVAASACGLSMAGCRDADHGLEAYQTWRRAFLPFDLSGGEVGALWVGGEGVAEARIAAWKVGEVVVTVDFEVFDRASPHSLRWEPGMENAREALASGSSAPSALIGYVEGGTTVRRFAVGVMRGENPVIDEPLVDQLWGLTFDRVVRDRVGNPLIGRDVCLDGLQALLGIDAGEDSVRARARDMVVMLESARRIEQDFVAGVGAWQSAAPMLVSQATSEPETVDFRLPAAWPNPYAGLDRGRGCLEDLRRLLDCTAGTRCVVRWGDGPGAHFDLVPVDYVAHVAVSRLFQRPAQSVAETREFLDRELGR